MPGSSPLDAILPRAARLNGKGLAGLKRSAVVKSTMHVGQVSRREERPILRLRVGCVSLAVAAVAACGSPTAPTGGASSLSVGQWSGTTSQGMSITFTVSPDETLTGLSIGYRVNGCSGSEAFTNLSVRTAPEVICPTGPCPSGATSHRAFIYGSGVPGQGASTSVRGLFLPGGRAEGQATFEDFPNCGSEGPVTWTATRR